MSLPQGQAFPPTRWTLIRRLREHDARDQDRSTVAELCQMYWPPLYGFVRRQGWSTQDAEDLTQGFFARLLDRDLFTKADRERGSLRSYLLGAIKHYISEHKRGAACQKRGGGQTLIPLDAIAHDHLERELLEDPRQSAEADFDRRWFDSLLEGAMLALEQEYRRRNQGPLFECLLPFLGWNRKDCGLAKSAKELGLSHGAIRIAIMRLRRRLRERIEEQVSQTVADPAQAEEELAHMRRIFGAKV